MKSLEEILQQNSFFLAAKVLLLVFFGFALTGFYLGNPISCFLLPLSFLVPFLGLLLRAWISMPDILGYVLIFLIAYFYYWGLIVLLKALMRKTKFWILIGLGIHLLQAFINVLSIFVLYWIGMAGGLW